MVKIEVEGTEQELREIERQLKAAQTFDVEVSWVDRATEHEMDTAELAYERLSDEREDMSQVTVAEVADKAGLPRDVTEKALEDLGLRGSLWSTSG